MFQNRAWRDMPGANPEERRMPLSPDTTELHARARADLRMGVPVVLTGPEGAALVAAVEP